MRLLKSPYTLLYTTTAINKRPKVLPLLFLGERKKEKTKTNEQKKPHTTKIKTKPKQTKPRKNSSVMSKANEHVSTTYIFLTRPPCLKAIAQKQFPYHKRNTTDVIRSHFHNSNTVALNMASSPINTFTFAIWL